jgi:hypothetical protein
MLTVTVPSFGVEGLLAMTSEWLLNEITGAAETTGQSLTVFDHVKISIEAEDKDFRFKTKFHFLAKTAGNENAVEIEKKRKAAEKEMFPDRLEERPSSF